MGFRAFPLRSLGVRRRRMGMDTGPLLGAALVRARTGGMVWRAGMGRRFWLWFWIRIWLWRASVRLVPSGLQGAVPSMVWRESRLFPQRQRQQCANCEHQSREQQFLFGQKWRIGEPLCQHEQAGRTQRGVAEYVATRTCGAG